MNRIPLHSASKRARGFTLMELLLVIAILGVLTTLALAVLRSAGEQARVSATQARINKIEAMLNAELERYEVRRLPISNDYLRQLSIANSPGATNQERELYAKALGSNTRNRIIQDLINVEFPRSAGDLTTYPGPVLATWLDANFSNPFNSQTLRAALTANPPAMLGSLNQIVPNLDSIPMIARSELLYQVLSRIDSDGMPAIESLGASAFGDTSSPGNNLLEILDAWGEPLNWEIWQVLADERGPENYEDFINPNWTTRQGYVPLNPTIPREVSQIRFRVFSNRDF